MRGEERVVVWDEVSNKGFKSICPFKPDFSISTNTYQKQLALINITKHLQFKIVNENKLSLLEKIPNCKKLFIFRK